MNSHSLGETVHLMFTTRAFASGVPTVLTSGEVQIYEDGGTTQITGAETLTPSLDGLVGMNHVSVAATVANTFESGKTYTAALSAGTVGGVNAFGEVVGQFRIETLAEASLKYAGPRGFGVYLNDAAANTTTVAGVDGIPSKPVSTIGAAKTIADELSIDRIYLVNDTAITLTATMEDYEFVGLGDIASNTINLGTQDVDNAYFENVLISGAQAGTGRFMANRCALSTLTALEIMAWECAIVGNLTVRADCYFDKCWSAVAGNGTPVLDINSVASVDISWRHYSGGLQINNAVSTTTVSYEADGQIIVGATCTSLALTVRGNCSITDSGTTTSLTQDAAFGSLWSTNLQKSLLAVVTGACIAGSTSTVIETDLTEATASHYVGRYIFFTSGALLGQALIITAYDGTATLTVTNQTADAPADTDTFVIL